MEHRIEDGILETYRQMLIEEEKAEATLEKYIRDVGAFLQYAGKYGYINKEVVMSYKEQLVEEYASASVNSMLAAVNGFLQKMGWQECVVKTLKVQKEAFRAPGKELTKDEYYRLLDAAQRKGNQRLYLLMQTVCATGIRISELKCITVESLRSGSARVKSKGKSRTVLLPAQLCGKLR